MNRLDTAGRARIVAALCEGNSVRAVSRMTGASKNTINKLLLELGSVCAEFQHAALRGLPCKRIQCDEIWSFCYAKDKNVPVSRQGEFGVGSVWTWTAICADTKLICSCAVGNRDAETANEFMADLAGRLSNRVQLTTDGHKPYLEAVDHAFSGYIDYAMLIKIYGGPDRAEETRYSPATCVGCEAKTIAGRPDRKHVSTSYIERQNLTMRMHMRRFTRLTNAFSKKIENHVAAISLHFMYYNFVRIHQTLRVTPAMAAGVTDRVWEVTDVIGLLEGRETEIRKDVARERNARAEARYMPSEPKTNRSI